MAAVENLDRLAGEPQLSAYIAPEAGPRRPIVLERRMVGATHALGTAGFLISTAVLAAREEDWPIAARMLAAASAPGGQFAGAPDTALFVLTLPLVRGALDKPTREAIMADARAHGPSHAVDVAVRWLAMEDVEAITGEPSPT